MLTNVIGMALILAVLVGACLLFVYGMVQLLDGDRSKGLIALAALFIGIAVVLGYAATQDDLERLCQRGHEQYQLRGKTMQRIWVCDER